MKETWLPVVGYEGFYEVSDCGRVRSLHREGEYMGRWGVARMVFPAREMKLSATSAGYRYLALRLPNQPAVKHLLHRLVMLAFVGPAPAEKPQVNHMDGDKANNKLENLEYVSAAENLRHCIDTLGKKRGEGAGNSKLTETQVRAIKTDGRLLREIASDYGVTLQTISYIRRGARWAHVQV